MKEYPLDQLENIVNNESIVSEIPKNSWICLNNLTLNQKLFVFNAFDAKPIIGLNFDFVNCMTHVAIEFENGEKYGYAYKRKKLSMLDENEISFEFLFNLYDEYYKNKYENELTKEYKC